MSRETSKRAFNLGWLRRALMRRFRVNRMRYFLGAFRVTPDTRILDLGGDFYNWSLVPDHPPLVVVNIALPRGAKAGDPTMKWVIADGRRLPFRDGTFDIVFSNAVIEHVGRLDRQRLFAGEIRRVGRSYFMQTPNRRFFFEPHLLTPFVHWLPRRLLAKVLSWGTVWGVMERPSRERRDEYIRDVWLLDPGQVRELFPDGRIFRERFLGMTKSIIAMKPNTDVPAAAPGGRVASSSPEAGGELSA